MTNPKYRKPESPKAYFQQDFVLVKKNKLQSKQSINTALRKPVYEVMPKLAVNKKVAYKSLVYFIITSFILTSAFQGLSYLSSAQRSSGQILGAATSAYGDLDIATKNLEAQDFQNASVLFESAKNSLTKAVDELNRFKLLTFIVPQAKSADHIIDGAYDLALGGQKLTSALSLYNDLIVSSKGVENANFTQVLKSSKNDLEESLKLFKSANSHFSQATSLPAEYESSVSDARNQITILTQTLDKMLALENLYLAFLGEGDKTYLVLFQNYDELRATGGFIGTYGLLKISDGKIRQLNIDSIYNLDGSLYQRIAAPGPFQPDIAKWGIRDANWFADFPTSAKKILYLFEKSKETADGVIAFTPKLFEDILRFIGPVEMPEYGVILSHENFQEVVQVKTSIEYDKEFNQPKKFLADFAPKMLDKLKNVDKEGWLAILQILNENFNEKHMLLYSTEQNTQDQISHLGFSGKILDTQHDYLAVINSNLGGTKTDLEMKQELNLTTQINPDGSVSNELKIKRINTSSESNRSYIRILVPYGSELIHAFGFDQQPHFSSATENLATDSDLSEWDKGSLKFDQVFVRTEANKTEFAGWILTPGVTEREISIRYILPFKLNFGNASNTASYSLLYQKQPGIKQTQLAGNWRFDNFSKIWNSYNVEVSGNTASFRSDSKTDAYWSILLRE